MNSGSRLEKDRDELFGGSTNSDESKDQGKERKEDEEKKDEKK